MTVLDDRGQAFSATEPPLRIVSLVPSISETLAALGAGDRLVGVTRYCTDPPVLRRLAQCGGTKNPDLARIESLAPDLVFLSEEENRVQDYEWLAARGIRVFVSFPRRVHEVPGWLRRVGAVAGLAAAAETMARDSEAGIAAVERRTASAARIRVFCPIWKKPWMTFNADTYTHSVVEACGAVNVFAGAAERYCTVTLAEVAGAVPELVLLPDEPYPFAAKDIADLSEILAPAGTAREARVVDGQALSWYGARTAAGLGILQRAILGGIV